MIDLTEAQREAIDVLASRHTDLDDTDWDEIMNATPSRATTAQGWVRAYGAEINKLRRAQGRPHPRTLFVPKVTRDPIADDLKTLKRVCHPDAHPSSEAKAQAMIALQRIEERLTGAKVAA